MKQALIIGASGGIGSAVAVELTGRGVTVTGVSRSTHGFDLRDSASVEGALAQITGTFELVFVATGALAIDGQGPEKTIRAIDANAMAQQMQVNAIGPAMVLKQAARLLVRDRRSVFACLSARVGSIGDNQIGGWVSYRSAKAALNQIVRTSAIELKRTHPEAVVVALHPGTVQTEFTKKYLGRHPSDPADVAAGRLLNVMENLTAEQSGGFYDYAGTPVPW